jgi:hypothetical protein
MYDHQSAYSMQFLFKIVLQLIPLPLSSLLFLYPVLSPCCSLCYLPGTSSSCPLPVCCIPLSLLVASSTSCSSTPAPHYSLLRITSYFSVSSQTYPLQSPFLSDPLVMNVCLLQPQGLSLSGLSYEIIVGQILIMK